MTEESNSSAPLTGWTKEWPTADGWRWVQCRGMRCFEPRAAYVWLASTGVWMCEAGDVCGNITSFKGAMFHPMEQPPAPPEVES